MTLSPTLIPLADHVEASAYTVVMLAMLKEEGKNGKDYLKGVGLDGDRWTVFLKRPLPMLTHLGIIEGIKEDQRQNPARWNEARMETVGNFAAAGAF